MEQPLYKKYLSRDFTDSIDESLDKLGPIGKQGVQMLDPTGISNWKDVKDSYWNFVKEGDIMSAAGFTMAALGAIPMFGLAAKGTKSLIKFGKNKLSKTVGKKLTKETTSILTDATKELSEAVVKKLTPILKKEATKIINKEFKNIFKSCKDNNMIKLTPEMETKVIKLNEKLSVLGGDLISIEEFNTMLLA